MRRLWIWFAVISFQSMVFFPVLASKPGAGGPVLPAKLIYSRLYRPTPLPEIEDFVALFHVKKNLSSLATHDESDLMPWSRGQLFFKKPYKFRAEITFLYPPGMDREVFITTRDGRLTSIYKSRSDYPLKQNLDHRVPPPTLPFGLYPPAPVDNLEITLLGKSQEGGERAFILGLVNRVDPARKITKIWVDEQRFYPIKAETPGTEPGKAVMIYFKNPILLPSGYWIPMRMERYEGNVLQDVIVYEQVAVNNQLGDDIFRAADPFHLSKPTGISP